MKSFNKRLALIAKKHKLFYVYREVAKYALDTQDEILLSMIINGTIDGELVTRKTFIKLHRNIKNEYQKANNIHTDS